MKCNLLFYSILAALPFLAGCGQVDRHPAQIDTKMDDSGMRGMTMSSSDSTMDMDKMSSMDMDKTSGKDMDKMSGMDMDKMSGMEMAKNDPDAHKVTGIRLDDLLQPGNTAILTSIPATAMRRETVRPELPVLGSIAYDTRRINMISARVAGRVERLYVRYRYQHVHAGQRIMDLYSPELETGERDLLFLLKNDPGNATLIDAARQRLLLLGVGAEQLAEVERTGRPSATLGVYSNYTGHIHDAGSNMTQDGAVSPDAEAATDPSGMPDELSLKEGMYVQKGQTLFQVFNMDRSWALLKIFPEQTALIRKGNAVRVVPETAPDKAFDGKVDEVLPLYEKDGKTGSIRVYFDNSSRDIPIGSQVKAVIEPGEVAGSWLPASAVLSLGMDHVVFLRETAGYRAHKVVTGIAYNDQVQVLSGLAQTDSVAVNAQFLIDSEDFIKLKE